MFNLQPSTILYAQMKQIGLGAANEPISQVGNAVARPPERPAELTGLAPRLSDSGAKADQVKGANSCNLDCGGRMSNA